MTIFDWSNFPMIVIGQHSSLIVHDHYMAITPGFPMDELVDLQRLADRAVHRFIPLQSGVNNDGNTKMTRIDYNHLKAHIAQIHSAHAVLKHALGDCDELDAVEQQLQVLVSIVRKYESTEPVKSFINEIESSSESDDGKDEKMERQPLIQSSFVKNRFTAKTTTRKPEKQESVKDKEKEGTIFRPEHDELSLALLEHSAALKANSSKLAGLLKQDGSAMKDAEKLMDTTSGRVETSMKMLNAQVNDRNQEHWGWLKASIYLLIGFLMFIFMYLLIRLT